MSNFSVEFNGIKYSVKSEEKSASWGHGVKLSIFKPDGTLLSSVSYSCHPEFDSFKHYQAKTIAELTEIAVSRLASDMDTTDFKTATENNIRLLLPINNA